MLQLLYFTANQEGTILHAHSSLIGRLQRYERSQTNGSNTRTPKPPKYAPGNNYRTAVFLKKVAFFVCIEECLIN